MFNKILVVCVGNICRSPMAEALFKHALSQKHPHVSIHSAGINALSGHPADPIVTAILAEKEIDCQEHRARQLTQQMLLEADVVLVMEKGHADEITRQFPSACGKVHLLGKWGQFEIEDPYRQPKAYFEKTYELISQGVKEWKVKLWN